MSKELLKSVFNDVYVRVYGDEYRFGNSKVEKSLDKFLSLIDFVFDENWVYEFVVFQFEHYRGIKSKFDRVYVNWVFGETALKRFKERTEEQIYYADKYRRDLGIVTTKFSVLSLVDYEEKERRRFDDMDRQFLHCHENDLFDIGTCQFCQLYNICSERNM